MTPRRAAVALAVVAIVALVVWRSVRSGANEGGVETDVAVHVTEIRRGTMHRFVTAYGRVEPRPAGDGRASAGAMITPFVDGVLAEIRAVEGRRVSLGDVLFRLDTRLAEVAVQRAEQQAQFARAAFERQERLLSSDGTSQRAYLEAQQQLDVARAELATAETSLSYLNITSPVTGTVLSVSATLGQHVDATTTLAQVADLSRLVVSARVPAREIAGVAVGETALIGLGDAPPEGEVAVVGGDIDASDGTYRVQASIPSEAGFVPGQFTSIRIQVEERTNVLVVPEASVVTGPDGISWVAVVEGDFATRSVVTLGLRGDGLAEVSGPGVREGLVIVTEEAYGLPEETRVRVIGG